MICIDRGFRHRWKVIFENEGAFVRRIANAISSWVPRTEIAVWIEGRTVVDSWSGHFALPWAIHASRRNEHPFSCERVVSAMGFLLQIQHGNRQSCPKIRKIVGALEIPLLRERGVAAPQRNGPVPLTAQTGWLFQATNDR